MSLVPYLHLDAELATAEAGTHLALDSDARHHVTRVLRLRDGAAVRVSDGRGAEADAQLEDGGVRLTSATRTSPPPRPRLTVAQGLPRSRKLDEVVRQVTELGADHIVPVAADRSVARLEGDRAGKAVERWGAVARAAAEQSRRPWRPEVAPVVPSAQLVDRLPRGTRLLVAHVAAQVPLPGAVGSGSAADHLAIAVGPEGGWSDDEVTAFVDAGATAVGLGPTVLRTEHAAAAALAVLAAVAGRWD